MEKEGLSGIITVILIILISIIGISIIWLFVQPAIVDILGKGGDGGEYNRFVSCTDLNLEAESCFYNETDVEVLVSRGPGSQAIDNLVFQFPDNVFSLNQGEGSIPGEFGSSSVRFSISLFSIIPENVKATAILDSGQACQFDDLPVRCEPEGTLSFECGNGICEPGENELTCPQDCQGQLSSCADFGINVVELSDFDLETCTRTRFGLIPGNIDKIPSAGVRIIGSDYANAKNSEASFGRDLIQWYTMYGPTGEGELDFSTMDAKMAEYKSGNLKVILTLRANHPNKSEVGFNIGGRTLFEPDSYPKNITEWTDYLQAFADRYYVNPSPEHAGVLAAIQVGNEWGHQFEVNGSYGRWNSNQRDEAILSLQNVSYNAIKEIAPSLPVVAFAVSGTPAFTLGAGYNEDGWIYDGQYYNPVLGRRNGISIIRQEDVGQNTVESFRRAMVNGSPFYDYFDAHIYFQNPEEARYVANFVRDTWRVNGISNKGLISTEFAVPIFNYSYGLHGYNVKAAQAVAFHAGFDAKLSGSPLCCPLSPLIFTNPPRGIQLTV